MNFFTQQERARKLTRRMLVLFALAVVAIVVATDFVVMLFLAKDGSGFGLGGMLPLSLLVVGVIGAGSLYRTASLRSGGEAVARGLGAVPVPPGTTDFAYRRLRNVVEEIAIASGVPVPEVFVLEEESGINAFAAGYSPADAAVTVTRGALDKLTRDELQGVIGHEFSHVLNGDMRLNIRLMGIVFGILLMATVGRRIATSVGRSRARDAAGLVLFGLALFAVGYIGVVFARAIKASIARQREYLADASAVQFTRQTSGIAGALKKIAGLAEGSKLDSAGTEEVAHMLFGEGLRGFTMFATHPPIGERIKRLDPAFRPEELERIAAAWSEPVRVEGDPGARADVSIAGFAPAGAAAEPMPAGAGAVPARDASLVLVPGTVAGQVGQPGSDDRMAARTLRRGVPESLRAAAAQSGDVIPLVLALALHDDDASLRDRQLAMVEARQGAAMRDAVDRFAREVAALHPMLRLPLAALAFPALRRRPRPQLAAFMIGLRELVDADGRVTLGEYCLARLLEVQVVDALEPARHFTAGRVRLPQAATELRDLLAILARHGHDDDEAARKAYALGLQEVLPGEAIALAPPVDWQSALDCALRRLDHLAPAGKELVVRALTATIGADGRVAVAEAELLRTICAALHCPLPPLLEGGRG